MTRDDEDRRRWFRVQAIGVVRRPGTPGAPPRGYPAVRQTAPGEFLDPWAESVLEIDPRWTAGLDGLEEFSHLVVLFYLDRATRRRTAGRPKVPEEAAGMPAVGFFATRTPKRPNPIGIACPRLLRRDGNRLVVAGIDAWDGTPVLDLKGYFPRDEGRPEATVPGWLTALWARHDAERDPRSG